MKAGQTALRLGLGALARRTLSRWLNRWRLAGLPAHARRVRQARRALATLRAIDGDGHAPRSLAYLRLVDPLVFEELVLTALEDGGRVVLRNRRYSGDGGIDGRVWLSGLGWCPLQCKRYRSHVAHEDVGAFAGLVRQRGCRMGLFVHSGRSGLAVYGHLAGSAVQLVSGQSLLDLVRHGRLPQRRCPTVSRPTCRRCGG